MRCAHPREGSGLSDAVRAAYLSLIGDADPAADLRADLEDLRPNGRPGPTGRGCIVSGPDDLRELREALEAVTGSGTWPFDSTLVAGERLTAIAEVQAPTASMFVATLAGVVEDRTRAWRTWRTVVESVAHALPTPFALTVDCVVVRPSPDRGAHTPS